MNTEWQMKLYTPAISWHKKTQYILFEKLFISYDKLNYDDDFKSVHQMIFVST